jgi:hypothetical protein
VVVAFLGCLLFCLSALGAAQLFTGQLFVECLAAIDTDLTALVFSAHALIVASRGSPWQKCARSRPPIGDLAPGVTLLVAT